MDVFKGLAIAISEPGCHVSAMLQCDSQSFLYIFVCYRKFMYQLFVHLSEWTENSKQMVSIKKDLSTLNPISCFERHLFAITATSVLTFIYQLSASTD